jgi:hypothetical protein
VTNREVNPVLGVLLALLVVLAFAVAAFPRIEPGSPLPGGDADEYAHLAQIAIAR